MKYLKIIVLGFAALLGFSSCISTNKHYVHDYQIYANDFLSNYPTYTVTDWDAAKQKYNCMREQYTHYLSDFSPEERQTIDSLNSQINAVFIKYETANTINQIESLFNETIGTINELLK